MGRGGATVRQVGRLKYTMYSYVIWYMKMADGKEYLREDTIKNVKIRLRLEIYECRFKNSKRSNIKKL